MVRREAGEPVAYIREVKEFYGFALSVDTRALIPRPETELLVELAVSRTRAAISARPRGVDAPRFRVLDVGTGSGAIAIAMARTLRRAGFGDVVRFTASDISEDAIALALENAVSQGVADLIDFRVADLLSTAVQIDEPPGVIVANLPYVASAALDALGPAIAFEPRLALDGGPDGLDVIRRLLDELPRVLAYGRRRAARDRLRPGGHGLGRGRSMRLPDWPATVHSGPGRPATGARARAAAGMIDDPSAGPRPRRYRPDARPRGSASGRPPR